MKTWFDPQPPDAPLRLPRQWPKRVVPSLIGDAGQVLNLLMHHGARGVVRDYSGFGNHGTLIGGVSWRDGSFGWALDFDGATGYVNSGNLPSLNNLAQFTYEVWVIERARNSYAMILDKTLKTFYVHGVAGFVGSLNAEITSSDGNFGSRTQVGDIPLGVPTHCAVTYDDLGDRRLHLYINGVEGTYTIQGTVTGLLSDDSGETQRLAARPGIGVTYFPGIIALPRIYNVDKGAAYIRRSFERTRAIFGV